MKIISGDYKYRNIEVPKEIRPTTEKVREAIFSMINDWIPNAVVFDIFAGSGVMGLEALSRGAAKCYFNESDRKNFKVLKSNIAHCKADKKSVIFNYDYLRAISKIEEKIDIFIIDPPYHKFDYYEKCFLHIQEKRILDEGAIVVAEHIFRDKLYNEYDALKKIKEKKYGSIGVDIFLADDILIK
ncbi:MAG TPA: 16S rRNA (guanine(966)-N(2))-methyltransferase RsmD [Mogibacterium sp.]|nr:16S rRNA (guanine(966)-N(2))-methyltransferase RsmD [Mogibacterium sp.]